MLYVVSVIKESTLLNGGTKTLFVICINNTALNDMNIIEQNNPSDISNILDFPSR